MDGETRDSNKSIVFAKQYLVGDSSNSKKRPGELNRQERDAARNLAICYDPLPFPMHSITSACGKLYNNNTINMHPFRKLSVSTAFFVTERRSNRKTIYILMFIFIIEKSNNNKTRIYFHSKIVANQ